LALIIKGGNQMRETTSIKGVGPVLAKSCADRGYRSAKDIASATVSDLKVVPGINDARARQLIAAAKTLLKGASPAATAGPAKHQSPSKKKKKGKKMKTKMTKKKKNKKQKKKKQKKKKSKSGKKN
jgi:Holliday junction resolvasome RuvABC DNA-binding subunit